MGELIFIDLRDMNAYIQIVCKKSQISNLTKESVIQVSGKVTKRKEANPKMVTGEIEVIASDIIILAKAETPPFVIKDNVDAKEEIRLKYRYLDLRRKPMQNNLILRNKLFKAIRDFLEKENFLEIETPILSKSTPEGARDFLVPTRNKNKFFALPQSPQIYKQLLMASGFEKYFQIAKVFRDEDLRADRQYEFTQLDLEMAFTDEEEIKNLIEKMMCSIFNKLNLPIKTPFQRMDYDVAMNDYGSDKPDLRFDNKLIDLKSAFLKNDFQVFKNANHIKGLVLKEVLTKQQIKDLENEAKKNGAKGLA
jgi:aspartyl-tRNA synthetase